MKKPSRTCGGIHNDSHDSPPPILPYCIECSTIHIFTNQCVTATFILHRPLLWKIFNVHSFKIKYWNGSDNGFRIIDWHNQDKYQFWFIISNKQGECKTNYSLTFSNYFEHCSFSVFLFRFGFLLMGFCFASYSLSFWFPLHVIVLFFIWFLCILLSTEILKKCVTFVIPRFSLSPAILILI